MPSILTVNEQAFVKDQLRASTWRAATGTTLRAAPFVAWYAAGAALGAALRCSSYVLTLLREATPK